MINRVARVLTMVTGLLLANEAANGQSEEEKGHFTVYGAISLPQGDWADDAGNDAGLAKLGIGAGADFTYPVGSPGLGWVTGVGLFINPIDADEIGVDIDASPYINLPVLSGLKYQGEASPTLEVYGLAQVGMNFLKHPTFEDGGEELSFPLATSFGFAVGGGLIINSKINLGLKFLALGTPEVTGEIDGVSIDGTEMDRPMSALLLTIGIEIL